MGTRVRAVLIGTGLCLLIATASGSFLYGLVRSMWNFDSSFKHQIERAGYSNPKIEQGESGRSKLYIGRVKDGKCKLRFERLQQSNDFHLAEVNGDAISYPRDNPTKQQITDYLRSQNIRCG